MRSPTAVEVLDVARLRDTSFVVVTSIYSERESGTVVRLLF